MATSKWSNVILIGDSLTQFGFDVNGGCWASMLADSLQRISDVITRGFSGYTSRSLKYVLPDLLEKRDYDQAACVILFIGANDCCDETSIQHVPKGQTEKNCNEILEYLKAQGVAADRIIMLTPPCFFYEDFQALHGDKIAQRTPNDYSEIIRRVAIKSGVNIVDLNKLSNQHPEARSLFSDGLHFNRKGGEFVYNAVWPQVKEKVTQFHGKFEMNLPLWGVIEQELQ